jgi:hypothetical protein
MSSEPVYRLSFTLPRDVSEYEPTSHFLERLKYRTDPEPSKDIARQVIEEGRILCPHGKDQVIFEAAIEEDGVFPDEYDWRVVVAVNRDAFVEENERHRLLTIYALREHGELHPEVFDQGVAQ